MLKQLQFIKLIYLFNLYELLLFFFERKKYRYMGRHFYKLAQGGQIPSTGTAYNPKYAPDI